MSKLSFSFEDLLITLGRCLYCAQASSKQVHQLTAELEAATRAHADAERGRASAEAAAEAIRSNVAAEQLASLGQQQKQAEEREKVCAAACLRLNLVILAYIRPAALQGLANA